MGVEEDSVKLSVMSADSAIHNFQGEKKVSSALPVANSKTIFRAKWRWRITLDSALVCYMVTTKFKSQEVVTKCPADHDILVLLNRIEVLEKTLLEQNRLSDNPTPGDSETPENAEEPSLIPGDLLAEATNQNARTKRSSDDGETKTEPPRSLHLVNIRDSFVSNSPHFSDGLITHWVVDMSAFRMNEHHLLALGRQYELVNTNNALLIKQPGLYQIYAQLLFEAHSGTQNQFEIRSQYGNRNPKILTTCSSASPEGAAGVFDVSCYTSVTTTLSVGDKIYIQVNEIGRRINTEVGKSFFGILKLA